jgi:hypothetical protein
MMWYLFKHRGNSTFILNSVSTNSTLKISIDRKETNIITHNIQNKIGRITRYSVSSTEHVIHIHTVAQGQIYAHNFVYFT